MYQHLEEEKVVGFILMECTVILIFDKVRQF